jgi:hypothetical protein
MQHCVQDAWETRVDWVSVMDTDEVCNPLPSHPSVSARDGQFFFTTSVFPPTHRPGQAEYSTRPHHPLPSNTRPRHTLPNTTRSHHPIPPHTQPSLSLHSTHPGVLLACTQSILHQLCPTLPYRTPNTHLHRHAQPPTPIGMATLTTKPQGPPAPS